MYYFSNVFERELYPVVNIHFADAEYLRVELAVNRIGPLPADSRYSFHHAYNRTRRCGVAVGGEACLNGAAENLLMYNPNDTGYTYYAIFKLPILTATPDTDPITHSITVTADENGTASASAEAAVKDTEITLTAAPNEGFRFKEWQVIKGGVELENKSIATFKMPAENVILEAIFESDGTEGDKPTLPDIPKPDKPGTSDKPGATDVPDTGDTTNVLLWAAALVIGGGATIGTVVSKKKKREES